MLFDKSFNRQNKKASLMSRVTFNAMLGLRRCAPFSLPPRAIIDQGKSDQLALSAFALIVIR